MLDRERDLRRLRRPLRIARHALRSLHEYRAAVAAAEVEHGRHAFVDPELSLPAVELLIRIEIAPAAPAAGLGLLGQVEELGIRVTMSGRFEMRGHFARGHREDEL